MCTQFAAWWRSNSLSVSSRTSIQQTARAMTMHLTCCVVAQQQPQLFITRINSPNGSCNNHARQLLRGGAEQP